MERGIEKLQTLKSKVKKLDPNQESLNNITVRMSISGRSLSLYRGDASTRSSNDLRRSIAASSQLSDDPSEAADDRAGERVDHDELQGKI